MLARNPHRGTTPAPGRRGLTLALLPFLLVSTCGGPPRATARHFAWAGIAGTDKKPDRPWWEEQEGNN